MPYRETGNISFITLLAFTFSGQFLFKFFSISTNNFRIAASFIILKIGYDMLQTRFTNTKLKTKKSKHTPMTFHHSAFHSHALRTEFHCQWNYVDERYQYMDYKGILIGMIALIYFITYLILRNSTRLVSILGKTVNNVIMRLMGLILMVIAVKCFVSELKPILIDIIQSSRM